LTKERNPKINAGAAGRRNCRRCYQFRDIAGAAKLEEVTDYLFLRYRRQGFNVEVKVPYLYYMMIVIQNEIVSRFLERNMGEVIRFVPKSELERVRLIRESRAIYESVFPSADAVNRPRYRTPIGRAVGDANVDSGDNVKS
jgi:hypothetical protein